MSRAELTEAASFRGGLFAILGTVYQALLEDHRLYRILGLFQAHISGRAVSLNFSFALETPIHFGAHRLEALRPDVLFRLRAAASYRWPRGPCRFPQQVPPQRALRPSPSYHSPYLSAYVDPVIMRQTD